MMVKLSERLTRLAEMVQENGVFADIGTDHAYLPIYLVQTKKIKRAIAMDIGKGPLLSAKEHIDGYGLTDYIETRRSDGAEALLSGEADTILIAGMGGGLTLHILTAGKEIIKTAKELILQPQSEIEAVRKYLYDNGFGIDREDMVFEDGKYYPMIHIFLSGKEKTSAFIEEKNLFLKERNISEETVFRYGLHLLKTKNEILYQFLLQKKKQYQNISENLEKQEATSAITERKEEMKQELIYIEEALSLF